MHTVETIRRIEQKVGTCMNLFMYPNEKVHAKSKPVELQRWIFGAPSSFRKTWLRIWTCISIMCVHVCCFPVQSVPVMVSRPVWHNIECRRKTIPRLAHLELCFPVDDCCNCSRIWGQFVGWESFPLALYARTRIKTQKLEGKEAIVMSNTFLRRIISVSPVYLRICSIRIRHDANKTTILFSFRQTSTSVLPPSGPARLWWLYL